VRRARSVILVLTAVAISAAAPVSAQSLTFSLFERYLESYREQYGIPALSVAVVQHGTIVWEAGLGKQDLEANVNATPDTPYFIGGLSQIFGSTLVLQKCLDQNTLELSDRMTRWMPTYADPSATVGQLLSHQTAAGAFSYDPGRFTALTGVVEQCAALAYRHVLSDVFASLAMTRSVPGRQIEGTAMPGRVAFSPGDLARYNGLVGQMARSYRLDKGRPVRSTVPAAGADAATGVITTVRDLARFDKALSEFVLLTRPTLTAAWTQAVGATSPLPTGLGWFVQNYNGEPLVWQFDLTRDAASSMVVKLPARDTTLIVLANSDGLTAPFGLSSGDATLSPFVRLFLRFFAP
jgi:CubicO group peptidase (beta-lactamase class C family)